MKILGIESSCDETAAALLDIEDDVFDLKTNVISSQIDIHKAFGGVVPEVAARNHVLTVLPVIEEALGGSKPDAIAVTSGPGLMTSLFIGLNTARVLASAWDVPLIRVNHIEGHLLSNWLELSDVSFPALGLIVSGGHTELVLMRDFGDYEIVGQTRDDAVGEAFDKVAKLLGLGYPGGPIVEKTAADGNPESIKLPRPMMDSGDFDFSLSGLKTAVLYLSDEEKARVPDVCASFQQAVIDVLISKTVSAAKHYRVKSVLFGGGVMASRALRAALDIHLPLELPGIAYSFPGKLVCTDNAAMIAAAGYFHAIKNDFADWRTITVDPNWRLHDVKY